MRAVPVLSTGRRRSVVTVLSLAALVALAGCGSSAGSSASSGATGPIAGQTITLYNAQHEQTTSALVAAFTAKTGVKVKVRSDDEDLLTAQIEQEGGHSPADVFYAENSPWLAQLDAKGMLAKVDASTLAQVPAKDSGSTGDWVGVSARVSAIVYNTQDLTAAQVPTSVLALADPQWKGKLDLAPSETDFWPVVSSVAAAKGDAYAVSWLKALKANAGSYASTPDNETITSDVNKGVRQIGLINHYYFYRLRAEIGAPATHAALRFLAPATRERREHLRGGRAALEPPPGRGPGVPRLPHEHPGPGDPRAQRQLRVPDPSGGGRQPAAAAAVGHAPERVRRGRARHR